jgi:hypothetical protein
MEIEDCAMMVSGTDDGTDDGELEMPHIVPADSQVKLKREMKFVPVVVTKKEEMVGKVWTNKLTPASLYPDLELALHFISPYHVTIEGETFIRTFASNYKSKSF